MGETKTQLNSHKFQSKEIWNRREGRARDMNCEIILTEMAGGGFFFVQRWVILNKLSLTKKIQPILSLTKIQISKLTDLNVHQWKQKQQGWSRKKKTIERKVTEEKGNTREKTTFKNPKHNLKSKNCKSLVFIPFDSKLKLINRI